MELKTVAVIGAGAIGSYFIDGLYDVLGENLWVVAEGERRERLLQKGLTVNGNNLTLNVKTSEEAKGADLLIVAVKYGALRGSLPMIQTIVTENTVVLSPLNGVDSEQIIGDAVGDEHVVRSIIKIASQRVGNEVVYNPDVTQGIFFGETDGEMSDRICALKALFDRSKVHYILSKNINKDIWLKYALNISMNLPQAIIGCGIGAYTDSEHMAFLSERMRDEVVAVAAAKGIDISSTDNPASTNGPIRPESRFSTLQDLDAGRPTEIDMFSGTLIRMGEELGVATPFNEFAYHVIKSLEEKNAGIIR